MSKGRTIILSIPVTATARYLTPEEDAPPNFYEAKCSLTLDGKTFQAKATGRGQMRSIAFALRELSELVLAEFPAEFG